MTVKHKVGSKSDMTPGMMREVEVGGAQYLIANVNGSFYAMDARCSHMGGALASGKLEGFVVQCPRHGSRFDVRTGDVISGPKIPLIGKAKRMRSYRVVFEGEDVYLELES